MMRNTAPKTAPAWTTWINWHLRPLRGCFYLTVSAPPDGAVDALTTITRRLQHHFTLPDPPTVASDCATRQVVVLTPDGKVWATVQAG